MTTYFRTAVLFVALIALAAIASCTGTATPGFTALDKAPAAKPGPKPVALAAVTPGEASAPVLAHYTAAVEGGPATIVKWEWKFNGGWEDHTATGGEVWKTYTTVGTKVAHLRVTNFDGQMSAPVSVKLIVRPGLNAEPVALFGLATTNSTNFSFTAEGSYDPDGTIVQWEWDFDSDGTYEFLSLENGDTAHSFAGGDHDVTLRVTDNDGAATTTTFSVHGNFPPNAVITVVGDPVPDSGSLTYTLSFADSSDVEGPLYDATVTIDGGTPELWDVNDPFEVTAFEGQDAVSVVLTVRDGLWATGMALASVSFEDGVVIALP